MIFNELVDLKIPSFGRCSVIWVVIYCLSFDLYNIKLHNIPQFFPIHEGTKESRTRVSEVVTHVPNFVKLFCTILLFTIILGQEENWWQTLGVLFIVVTMGCRNLVVTESLYNNNNNNNSIQIHNLKIMAPYCGQSIQ